MFSKFALGMLTATLVTTKEGNDMLKAGGKIANKVAKKKLGLDLKDLFEDDEEVEVVEGSDCHAQK